MFSSDSHGTTTLKRHGSSIAPSAPPSQLEQPCTNDDEAHSRIVGSANRLFGFNGWSTAIRGFEIDFVDIAQSTGRVSVGLSVIVRLSLSNGPFHDDIGYGHVEDCDSKAVAFEKAKKGATTNALSRAFRYFENICGQHESPSSTSEPSQCEKGRKSPRLVTNAVLTRKNVVNDPTMSGDRVSQSCLEKPSCPGGQPAFDEFGSDPFEESDCVDKT